MERINCWEFNKCGRQPGGENIDEFGVCPTTTDTSENGTNGGKNGGRFCWKIAGTFCNGKIQGSSALKLMSCVECDFLKIVKKEEENKFRFMN
jgi:hypothetical protein